MFFLTSLGIAIASCLTITIIRGRELAARGGESYTSTVTALLAMASAAYLVLHLPVGFLIYYEWRWLLLPIALVTVALWFVAVMLLEELAHPTDQ